MNKKIECFACGRKAMIQKKGITKLADGIKVKSINKWICENCGEELFDLNAMKKIRIERKKESQLVQ